MKVQVMVAGATGRVTEPVLLALLLLLPLLVVLLGGGQMAVRSSGETSPGLATATFNPAGADRMSRRVQKCAIWQQCDVMFGDRVHATLFGFMFATFPDWVNVMPVANGTSVRT